MKAKRVNGKVRGKGKKVKQVKGGGKGRKIITVKGSEIIMW